MKTPSSFLDQRQDATSLSITDAVMQRPVRKQYIFPKFIPKREVTVVSMNVGVDGAPLASVCAVKAASGGTLPMFGNGAGLDVNLFIGGIDEDEDADTQAFQQVLLDEEKVHCQPDQWPGTLHVHKQGQNEWGTIYLDTPAGLSDMEKRLQPESLAVIYDLNVWLKLGELTDDSATELLSAFGNLCIEKDVTLLIFERHSPERPALAAKVEPTSEVLQLVTDKKGPSLTGSGCSLLRKKRGYFDLAPRACSFWISLTDAGILTWGMEPSEGPQLAQRELDAVQRRILTAQWRSGERTPRQIAALLGKDPANYPDKLNQQGFADMIGVDPSTTSRDLRAMQKNGAPRDA